MQECGLDPNRYGFICHDAWDYAPELFDIIQIGDVLADETIIESGVPDRLSQEDRDSGSTWVQTGEVKHIRQHERVAGDMYSFRPDELLLFLARGFEARLARLEALIP